MKKGNKVKRMLKRITSLTLVTAMLCGLWSGTELSTIAATESTGGVVLTVDDPQTLTRPVDTFGNSTLNAGKILVGKSVTDGMNDTTGETEPLDLSSEASGAAWTPEENNFLVTISQSAQMYGVSSKIPVPLDVVFVLDTSGSMIATDSGSSVNRAHDAVAAINTAISSLMQLNDQNRVSVVAFSGHNSDWANDGATTADNDAANVLSELKHYEGTAATNHLVWDGAYIKGRATVNGQTASRNGYSGGTNIQAGIALGAQQLLNAEDTTVTIEGKEYTRMPFIILVSDGAPIMSSPDNEWWNPSMIAYQNGINYAGYDNWGTYTYAGNSFLAVLTASYYKEQIGAKYYPNGENAATFYTIGLGLDAENDGDDVSESRLSRMTLNPTRELNNTANQFYNEFQSYWSSYSSGQAFSVEVGPGGTSGRYSNDGKYYFYPADTTQGVRNDYQIFNSRDEQQWIEVSDGTLMKDNIREEVDSLMYNDAFYDVETSGQLAAVFKELIIEIQKRAITDPTLVDAAYGDEFSGYVNFTDPIGEYMEVKDLKGVTSDGYLYEGKKFAQLAENYGTGSATGEQATFNQALEEAVLTRMQQAGSSNIDLASVQSLMATVVGTDPVYGGQIYYNSDTDYSNSFVWFGTVHYPEDSEGESEEDYKVKFVQLAPKDADSVTWLQDTANADVIQAAVEAGANCIVRSYYLYGSAGGVKESTGEYLNFAIRIIRSLEAPYNQYVSVSAPASLLAVQNVLIDDTDPNNMEAHYTELIPTRVTYEVGLREDITAENVWGIVDAAYIQEYGNVNADGTINFYTNDYKRYDDAEDAAGHTGAEHDHAMTKVTFDVSESNSFYRYEEDTLIRDARGNAVTGTLTEGQTYYYERVYYTWTPGEGNIGQASKTSTYISITLPEGSLTDGSVFREDGKWYIKAGTYTAFTVTSGDDILKTANETVTAHIVSHPQRTGDNDNSHYTTWLGNNGKLTFKPVDPKTVYQYEDNRLGTANVDGKLVKVGDKLQYQIQATNSYKEKATIKITDAIPAGTELVSGSIREGIKAADGTITWNGTTVGTLVDGIITWVLEDVEPQTTVVVSFDVEVVEGAVVIGQVENKADIEMPAYNNKYETNITKNPVTGKRATDTIGDELPETGVKVGDVIQYQIAYFNDQEAAATVTITDIVPAGTTYVADSASHTLKEITTDKDGNVILKWEFKDIQPGTGGVVSFNVQVNASASVENGIVNDAIIVVNNSEVDIEPVTTKVDKGSLVLSKTVAGTETNQAFELTLTETTGKLSGTYVTEIKTDTNTTAGSVTFEGGVAKVEIRHGQTITVKDLPAGAVIKVTEDEPGAGFTATMSGGGQVTIPATEDAAENAKVTVDVTNTYQTEPVSVVIGGTKSFTNNDTYDKTQEFFFELTEQQSGTGTSQTVNDSASTIVTAGAGKTATEAITFNKITYTEEGTYVYKITERNTGFSGIKYDATEYTVTVVVEDKEGQLTVTSITYQKESESAKALTQNATTKIYGTAEIVFNNSNNPLRESISLIGKKTLNNAVLTNNQFSFVVKENGTEVATGQSKADGSIVFTTISYTGAGEHIYTIEEVQGTVSSMGTDTTKYYLKVVVTENKTEAKLEKAVYVGDSAAGNWTLVTGDELNKLLAYSANSTLAFTNTYKPNDYTVTLEGTKTLTGRNMAADEFDFVVNQVDEEGNFIKQAASGSNKEASAGVAADIVFQPISYKLSDLGDDKTETFYYVVSEVKEGKDGITYSDASFDVSVTVTYSDSTGWSAQVAYPAGGVHFENSFTPDPVDLVLTIGNKTTSGENQPDDLTFGYEVIKVSSTYDDQIPVGTVVATGSSGASGAISLTALTFVHEGTYKVWLKETNAGTTVHGVTYDNARYLIVIEVTRDVTTGVLHAEAKYYGVADANHTGSTNEADYTKEITDLKSGIAFSNDYAAKGSLTIEATKSLTGRSVLNAGDYEFGLYDEAGSLLHVGKNSAGTRNGTAVIGKVVFDTLNYTNDDLDNDPFVYIMKEIPGNQPGVTYDKSEYKVVVTLMAEGETITATPVITQIRDSKGDDIAPESQKAITGWPMFANVGAIYQGVSTTVALTKELTGRDLRDEEFSFVIKNTNTEEIEDTTLVYTKDDTNDDKKYEVSLDVSISAAEGAGTYTFEISEVVNNLGGVTYDGSVYQLILVVDDIKLADGVTDGQDGILDIVSKTVTQIKDSKGNNLDKTMTEPLAYQNRYEPDEAEVLLKAQKTLTYADTSEKMTLNADTFDFVIYQTDSDYIIDADAALRATGSNTADGLITFTTITLAEEGAFYYVAKELPGTVPGVTYDSTEYKIEITVEDNDEGKLTATVKVNGVEYDDTLTGSKAQMQFNNSYNAEDTVVKLTGTKTLTGRDMKAGEFTFYVYEGEDVVAIGTNAAAKDGKVADISFSEIPYTEAGEHTYVVKEVPSVAGGLVANTQEFEVKVNVTDDGEGTLSVDVAYTEGGISFVNKYEPTPVKATVLATKSLTGKPLVAGEFTFAIKDENGKEVARGTNNADGSITFDYDLKMAGVQSDGFVFDKAGNYTYTVIEISDVDGDGKKDNPDMTYDTSEQFVTIQVTDDGEGKLYVKVQYQGKAPAFTNVYTPEPLYVPITVSKILTGRELGDGEFSFTIKTLQGETVATGANQDDEDADVQKDSVVFVYDHDLITDGVQTDTGKDGIKFTQIGTYRYAIAEVADSIPGVTMDEAIWYIQIDVTQDAATGKLKMLHDNIHVVQVVNGGADASGEIVFTNTYDAVDAEVILTGTKKMDPDGDRTTVGEGEYLFHLIDEDGKVSSEGKTTADGTIVFDKLTYDKEDVYKYTLVEIPELTENGITYDPTEYQVVITVSEDKDAEQKHLGILKAEVSVTDKNGADAQIAFENKYTAEPAYLTFSGKKVLVGSEELNADQFAFELYETDETFDTADITPVTAKNTGSGTFAFDQIEYTEAGIHYYVVKEIPGTDMIYDEDIYRIRVEVSDNGVGQYVTEVIHYDGSEEEIVFTNVPFDETVKKDVFKKGDTATSIDGIEVVKGDVLTYEITYTNLLKEAVTVTITDAIPDDTRYAQNSASNGGVYENGIITWILDVAQGETVKVTFDVTVTPDEEGVEGTQTIEIKNKATVNDGKNEYQTNIVTNPTTISEDAHLVVKKYQAKNSADRTTDKLKVEADDVVTYTITATNTGAKSAVDVVVTDEIPAGLTYVKDSADHDGTCKDGIATWKIPEIKAGEAVELTFKVTVPKVERTTSWTNIGMAEYRKNPENTEDDKEKLPTNEVVIVEEIPVIIPEVTMEVTPEKTSDPVNASSTVETGDNAAIAVWLVIAGLALAVIAVVLVKQRRELEK